MERKRFLWKHNNTTSTIMEEHTDQTGSLLQLRITLITIIYIAQVNVFSFFTVHDNKGFNFDFDWKFPKSTLQLIEQ